MRIWVFFQEKMGRSSRTAFLFRFNAGLGMGPGTVTRSGTATGAGAVGFSTFDAFPSGVGPGGPGGPGFRALTGAGGNALTGAGGPGTYFPSGGRDAGSGRLKNSSTDKVIFTDTPESAFRIMAGVRMRKAVLHSSSTTRSLHAGCTAPYLFTASSS